MEVDNILANKMVDLGVTVGLPVAGKVLTLLLAIG